MKAHIKKMIAPIVVTVVMLAYYILYFSLLLSWLEGLWKYALGIIPAIGVVVMVSVCIERIKEIRKGEEDDISQY